MLDPAFIDVDKSCIYIFKNFQLSQFLQTFINCHTLVRAEVDVCQIAAKR